MSLCLEDTFYCLVDALKDVVTCEPCLGDWWTCNMCKEWCKRDLLQAILCCLSVAVYFCSFYHQQLLFFLPRRYRTLITILSHPIAINFKSEQFMRMFCICIPKVLQFIMFFARVVVLHFKFRYVFLVHVFMKSSITKRKKFNLWKF